MGYCKTEQRELVTGGRGNHLGGNRLVKGEGRK